MPNATAQIDLIPHIGYGKWGKEPTRLKRRKEVLGGPPIVIDDERKLYLARELITLKGVNYIPMAIMVACEADGNKRNNRERCPYRCTKKRMPAKRENLLSFTNQPSVTSM